MMEWWNGGKRLEDSPVASRPYAGLRTHLALSILFKYQAPST
jgi:hypothetical protein